ncbi:hypothetical protein GCM10012275_47440 [Longimycelium tulufanense]|uniref:Uncharacterized protein n=1 Tax=Longimycelium tulufanense TaxID=907463 RepID=A0A8J3CBW4_9PSEU|nr:hypothetical protein [Longimycelium tulufanense]GGM71483.1 hypothetical protein GCM10012275_47440 [Longimycelium tulufanense]
MGVWSAVKVGAWAIARNGSEVRCTIYGMDNSVEVAFSGSGESFELLLEHDVLEQCIVKFPEALRKLEQATRAEFEE